MKRFWGVALAGIFLTSLVWGQASSSAEIARARQLVDSERPLEAIEILRSIDKSGDTDAEALLLLSTAEFMLGNIDDECSQKIPLSMSAATLTISDDIERSSSYDGDVDPL